MDEAAKTSNENTTGQSTNNENVEAKKNLTVLESHGYTLGNTIGVGTYATVKIADSVRHGRPVAIKIISKFLAPSSNLNKFLPREIEALRILRKPRHANLIRLLEVIESTHRVYVIMEFAENGNLLDVIKRDRFIDEARARNWFRQLLDAVDFCHEKGVVHRDVKCENLLLDRNNRLKLSDFGFARYQVKPVNGVAVLCETCCGSFAYAAPEVLRGIPYQPQLSDIWSSGVVLYTMVFGALPFDESNWSRLLKQVQRRVVFPKSPQVSEECRNLILRTLVPQRLRPRIAEILKDVWLAVETTEAETSTDNSYLDPSTSSSKSTAKFFLRKSGTKSRKSTAISEAPIDEVGNDK